MAMLVVLAEVVLVAGKAALLGLSSVGDEDARFVLDPKGILTGPERRRLDFRIRNDLHAFLADARVVVVDTVRDEGASPKEVATTLFNEWNLGNPPEFLGGVLVLLAIQDRRIEIEFSDSLRGILTSDWCEELLHHHNDGEILHLFRDQRIAEGLDVVLREIRRKFVAYRRTTPHGRLVGAQRRRRGAMLVVGGAGVAGLYVYHSWLDDEMRRKHEADELVGYSSWDGQGDPKPPPEAPLPLLPPRQQQHHGVPAPRPHSLASSPTKRGPSAGGVLSRLLWHALSPAPKPAVATHRVVSAPPALKPAEPVAAVASAPPVPPAATDASPKRLPPKPAFVVSRNRSAAVRPTAASSWQQGSRSESRSHGSSGNGGGASW